MISKDSLTFTFSFAISPNISLTASKIFSAEHVEHPMFHIQVDHCLNIFWRPQKLGDPQVFFAKVGPHLPRYDGNPAGAASQRSGWHGLVPEWRAAHGAVGQERLQAGAVYIFL